MMIGGLSFACSLSPSYIYIDDDDDDDDDNDDDHDKGEVGGPGLCALLIAFLSLLLVLATLPFSLYMCVKV